MEPFIRWTWILNEFSFMNVFYFFLKPFKGPSFGGVGVQIFQFTFMIMNCFLDPKYIYAFLF